MASRLLSDLTPEALEKAQLFGAEMAAAGIPYMITCTYRSQEEQDSLYAQGRTKPGKIVTWTRHSKHTQRTAFDIAIIRDGKPCWDVKVDVDEDQVPDYLEAAKIGREVGLRAGADFGDLPHFELPEAPHV